MHPSFSRLRTEIQKRLIREETSSGSFSLSLHRWLSMTVFWKIKSVFPLLTNCNLQVLAFNGGLQFKWSHVCSLFKMIVLFFSLITLKKYSVSSSVRHPISAGLWTGHVTPSADVSMRRRCFHDTLVISLHMDPFEKPRQESQNAGTQTSVTDHQADLLLPGVQQEAEELMENRGGPGLGTQTCNSLPQRSQRWELTKYSYFSRLIGWHIDTFCRTFCSKWSCWNFAVVNP